MGPADAGWRARRGGVVAVGYRRRAVCQPDPAPSSSQPAGMAAVWIVCTEVHRPRTAPVPPVPQDCGKWMYLQNYLLFFGAVRARYPHMRLISNCDMGQDAPTGERRGLAGLAGWRVAGVMAGRARAPMPPAPCPPQSAAPSLVSALLPAPYQHCAMPHKHPSRCCCRPVGLARVHQPAVHVQPAPRL